MRTAAASRSQDSDRALSPVSTGFDIEGNYLTDIRAPAIARKRGNMDEDFGACACERNEAEAAIVIPPRQRAVGAHDNVSRRARSISKSECGIVYTANISNQWDADDPACRAYCPVTLTFIPGFS
jgi:hypothetical protein